MIYTSVSTENTKQLGRKLASQLKEGEVLCLYGDLGAGKTTFIQGFIKFFLPQKRVLSPTFIIVRHYRVPSKEVTNIYHIDLYRMKSERQIQDIGLSQLFGNPDTVVFIEWAEKLGNLMPKKRIDIRFEMLEEQKRRITII